MIQSPNSREQAHVLRPLALADSENRGDWQCQIHMTEWLFAVSYDISQIGNTLHRDDLWIWHPLTLTIVDPYNIEVSLIHESSVSWYPLPLTHGNLISSIPSNSFNMQTKMIQELNGSSMILWIQISPSFLKSTIRCYRYCLFFNIYYLLLLITSGCK